MRETAPEMVGDRFWDPFSKKSDKVQKWCQSWSKSGLENMELDCFWVVVAPFGLRLAVVRSTGPKFLYRPLFGHIGPPGAQNRPFWDSGVTSDFWPAPGLLLPIVPRGRRQARSLKIAHPPYNPSVGPQTGPNRAQGTIGQGLARDPR